MRLFNLRLVSGFLKLPDKPTQLPDERVVRRRVGREHRRDSNWNPTTTNTLLMLDTPAIVGFVGLFEKV